MTKSNLFTTILILVLIVPLPLNAKKADLGKRPLVQNIAGIQVGRSYTSQDKDVIKLFGKGLYIEAEGHTGGRYFVDPKRKITLHVELGVDRFVDTIELSEGITVPQLKNTSSTKIISNRLSATPKIDRNISLGISPEYLIRELGKPDKDSVKGSERRIIFEEYFEDDLRINLNYEATYSFLNNRLIKISIYDGE